MLAAVVAVASAQGTPQLASSYPYQVYVPVAVCNPRYTAYLPIFGGTESVVPGAAILPASAVPLPFVDSRPVSDCRGMVRRVGENLELDGQPFLFVGVNVSYLAAPEFPQSEVELLLATLANSGVTVVRIWVKPDSDISRLSYILDLGRQHHLRFIVTLQDYYFWKDARWFKTTYREVDLPHVRALVSQFADRPEILMWELMNEPGCGNDDWSPNCTEAVYEWAKALSVEIKALDPCHLVSVGTVGTGWIEAEEDLFRRVNALPTVDVVSVHRPTYRGCEAELRIAHELGKPVFYGEVYHQAYKENCRPLNSNALDERAVVIAEDLRRAWENGVDGYLLWDYAYGALERPDGQIQYFCGIYGYAADDPAWEVLRRAPVTRTGFDN